MTFFFVSFMINFKKVINKKSVLVVLFCLIILTCMVATFLNGESAKISLKVGVCYNEKDPKSAEIFNILTSSKSIEIAKFPLEQRVQMTKEVQNGKLECGYILDENFAELVENGETTSSATLVKSTKSYAYPIVNEMVYTAILKVASPQITAKVLEKEISANYNSALLFAENSIDAYENLDIFVKPNETIEGGAKQEPEPIKPYKTRLFKGTLCLFVIIISLFALPIFIDEKKNTPLQTLSLAKRLEYYASIFAVLLAFTAFFGAICLAFATNFTTLLRQNLSMELVHFVKYCATISAVSTLAIFILKRSTIVYQTFIFVILINIVFGGIVLDLTELSPKLAPISAFFPSNYYIINSEVSR